MNRSKQAILIAAAVTLGLLAADLGSKQWAMDTLSVEHPGTPPEVCAEPGRNQRLRSESIVLIEDFFELSYTENCGAAFGLLNDSPAWIRATVFGIAAVVASIALFVLFARGKGGWAFAASVPFVVSGALGNFVDRFRLGYVVDFIRVHYEEPFDILTWHFDRYEYPTFNVADITITIGVVLLILDGFLEEKRLKREAKKEAEEAAAEAEASKGGKKGRRRKSRKSERKSGAKKPSGGGADHTDDADDAAGEADTADAADETDAEAEVAST